MFYKKKNTNKNEEKSTRCFAFLSHFIDAWIYPFVCSTPVYFSHASIVVSNGNVRKISTFPFKDTKEQLREDAVEKNMSLNTSFEAGYPNQAKPVMFPGGTGPLSQV